LATVIIAEAAVGFGAKLDPARAVAAFARDHRAVEQGADLVTGYLAVHDCQVLGDDVRAQRETALRTQAVVVWRIDPAIRHHHVPAAIDVDAVAVGVHRDIVDGHVVATGGEDCEMAAAENRDIAEQNVPAKFQGDGFVAEAARVTLVRAAVGFSSS
jgi:hypothetical protein